MGKYPASVFLGVSGVTATTGDELPAGQSVVVPVANLASLYVVAVASGTSTVSWFGMN